MNSEKYTFFIDEESNGTRIDRVLSLLLAESSRSYIQKLIEKGNVSVDGQTCTSKKYKVSSGQQVDLLMPPPENLSVEPENIPLDIVYEDEDVLVVNKPRGMVVHPAAGNYTGTLVNAVLYHCGDRLSSINGVIRPGIVHRIDKDTSGHNLTEDEGTVDAPIGRDPKNRLRMAVTSQNSKRAVTHWKVLERFGRYTLMEARLET